MLFSISVTTMTGLKLDAFDLMSNVAAWLHVGITLVSDRLLRITLNTGGTSYSI